MSAWIRHNALAMIAIFIALTGTAMALPGRNTVDSGDIKKGRVKTSDLADAAVTTPKLAPGAVDSSTVSDDALTGADILESSLDLPAPPPGTSPTGPAGGDLTGSYPNPQVAADAVGTDEVDGSLTGADVDESSLDVSTFAVGRSNQGGICNPEASGTFTDCLGVTFALPRAGRVLIVAAGGQHSVGAPAEGDCRLEVDDATTAIPHSTEIEPGEEVSDNTDGTAVDGFSTTAVTDPLTAASHTFELSCDQDVGNVGFDDTTISALMIGAG